MDYKQTIKSFLEENFMVDLNSNFTDDDSFLENGIIDSTGVLELVLFIEENYDIKVQDEEVLPENLDSFNNLQRYLTAKINHAG